MEEKSTHRFVLAIGAAIGVAGVGGMLRWGIAKVFGMEIGYLAWGIAVCVGLCIYTISKTPKNIFLGVIGALITFFGIIFGKFLYFTTEIKFVQNDVNTTEIRKLYDESVKNYSGENVVSYQEYKTSILNYMQEDYTFFQFLADDFTQSLETTQSVKSLLMFYLVSLVVGFGVSYSGYGKKQEEDQEEKVQNDEKKEKSGREEKESGENPENIEDKKGIESELTFTKDHIQNHGKRRGS